MKVFAGKNGRVIVEYEFDGHTPQDVLERLKALK